jgi:GAF domain
MKDEGLMPIDPVRGPLDALRAHLREALDVHVAALSTQYDEALAAARRDATAEAERALGTRLETLKSELHAEWSSRLETEVAAARAEAERKLVAETMKARVEAEQQAAESTSHLRAELEHALAAERQRAEAQVHAERQRADATIAAERQRAAAELASAKSEPARAATSAVAASTAGVAADRLLEGLRAIDRAQTLTQVLDTLLKETARTAPRAIAFLVSGDRLRGWKAIGFETLEPQQIDNPITGGGLLPTAAKAGEPTLSSAECAAPTFVNLPADRAALAVPLVVGGHTVAVLYADNAGGAQDRTTGWAETVQILARHAAAALSLVTALRTLQTLTRGNGGDAPEGDDQGAKRYARLLVSEIKLYNEGAVRVGRQKRDLLQRLGPEIERARRLYEQRIPADVSSRAIYFQQELVHTLADGDAALLGNA